MGELRRHVFVFVGPNVGEDDEDDLLVAFAKKIQGWQLESTMNLPLTTKVKIDTAEGQT